MYVYTNPYLLSRKSMSANPEEHLQTEYSSSPWRLLQIPQEIEIITYFSKFQIPSIQLSQNNWWIHTFLGWIICEVFCTCYTEDSHYMWPSGWLLPHYWTNFEECHRWTYWSNAPVLSQTPDERLFVQGMSLIKISYIILKLEVIMLT